MTTLIAKSTAESTAIYRIYGEADLLLYIGISKDFGKRWRQHARKQPWWDEKKRLTVDEWYDSREEADVAETAAINAERPKYNQRKVFAKPLLQAAAEMALTQWNEKRNEWNAMYATRDNLIRDALAAGITKHRIHVITGIARTTIDKIISKEGD